MILFGGCPHENAPASRGVTSLEDLDELREVVLAEAIDQFLHGDNVLGGQRADVGLMPSNDTAHPS